MHFQRCSRKKCLECNLIENLLEELATRGCFSFPAKDIGVTDNSLMMRQHRDLKHHKREKDRQKHSESPIIIDEHNEKYVSVAEIEASFLPRFQNPPPA